MRRRLLIAAIVITFIASVGVAYAADVAVIVRDVSLAEFPRVKLQLDVPSTGASANTEPQFEIIENGRSVEVLSTHKIEADPVDVILAIDTSGSMKGASLEAAKKAAKAFIQELQPESKVGVVAFASKPRVVSPIGPQTALLASAIDGLQAADETALYDALSAVAAQSAQAGVKRPVAVLLSDGGDTVSRGTLDAALKELRAAKTPVLVVALPSAEADSDALQTIATQTGGRFLGVADAKNLVEVYRTLAQQLQTTWNVTYVSNRPATKDLDVETRVTQAGQTMVGSTLVANPLFDPAASSDASPLNPVPPANLITVVGTAVLVFVAVFALVAALALVFIRPKSALDTLKYYDQLQGTGDAADAASDDYSGAVTSSIMGAIDAVAGKRGIKRFVYEQLDRAGLPLRPTEYITIHLLAVIAAGILAGLLSGGSLIVAIGAALVGTLLPIAFIEYKIRSRHDAFEQQLPDVLNLISGALRAGWGWQQSVDLVVEQMAPPVSTEFARAQTEIRLGRAVEDALESVAERTESTDFTWAVTAIGIQREVGGNLAEVLDVVAATIRDRGALKRQISGLTAEGRISAYILLGLPFLLLALLSVVNPEYLGTLFTTVPGLVMLLIGAVLLVIGGIWLRNIVTIEV
jgi:tight adherence protein B